MGKYHNFKIGDTVYLKNRDNMPMTVINYGIDWVWVIDYDKEQFGFHYTAVISEQEYKDFHKLTT